MIEASQQTTDGVGTKHHGAATITASGTMATRIRRLDWASTSLGSMDQWPEQLLVAVNLMLNSPEAAAIWWGSDLVAFFNDRYFDLVAERQGYLLGQSTRTDFRTRLPESVLAELDSVLKLGESILQEDVLIPLREDEIAQDRYWNYSMVPIYLGGEVGGIFNTVRESTASLVAMRALSESEERLRMALSVGNGVGVWEVDFKNNAVYVDGKLPEFFGLNQGEASAGSQLERILQQVHPDDVDRVRQGLNLSQNTGCSYAMHHRIIKPDGSIRWVVSQAFCRTDVHGAAERLTGVAVEMSPDHLHALTFGKMGESYSREYVRSWLEKLVKLPEGDEAKVVSVDRIFGAVAVGFSDQRQILFPALVLSEMSSFGIELTGTFGE